MAGGLLTNGLIPPPGYFRVNDSIFQIGIIKIEKKLHCLAGGIIF